MHLVATKQLPAAVQHGAIAYCPTMDLVAVASAAEVTVFRLNGERVFGVAVTGNGVVRLRWRSDGGALAIADRTEREVRLVNTFSGRVVNVLKDGDGGAIQGIWWSVAFADGDGMRRRLQLSDAVLDDLLGLNAKIETLLDLPRALGEIDVEVSLPKLATLPATGAEDDVFSTRTSVDAIFHGGQAGQRDMVEVLITGHEGAMVHLRIFDSFEIGRVSLRSSLPEGAEGGRVLAHASHPFLSTHFLIIEAGGKLHLLRLDLNFVPLTGPQYLPILATKATQLQNLLRYLTQIQTQLTNEVRAAFDLPSRYLRNVNEALAEHATGADFVTAAYHLIVTGECLAPLKEWLADEVGERGSKRWEKAVGDCLDMVRRAVHECILPALERIYVVLSRLDGLARFNTSAKILGLEAAALERIEATANCMNLLANDLLRDVGQEVKAFGDFIKWFKGEVEVQGMEEGSERREELSQQRGDEVDVKAVLAYLDGPMRKSKILDHLRAEKEEDKQPSLFMAEQSADGVDFYKAYKDLRRSLGGKEKLPKLDELISRMKEQCEQVFKRIAATLRESVMHSLVTTLPPGIGKHGDADVIDMRVIQIGSSQGPDSIPIEDAKSRGDDTYLITVLYKHAKIKDQMVRHSVLATTKEKTGKTTTSQITATAWETPDRLELVDLKFVDDTSCMILASDDNGSYVYSRMIANKKGDMENDTDWDLRHQFEVSGRQSRPAKLEVNGRKGRRVVCVLDVDGMRYSVFDLDNADEQGDEEAMEA